MVLSKGWSISRKGSIFTICILVAVLPMAISVLYRIMSWETIGPWIGGLAILNVIVLPFLFYFAIVSESTRPWARLMIGFGALVLGEFLAILSMYLFTRLASLMEILEYTH